MEKQHNKKETAYFAAGCFWGVQEAFDMIDGVLETEVGYSGGHTEKPSYEKVCSDTTGHAETVNVVFDPEKISYKALVAAFWNMHNPTTKNRQGPDVGSQYRSIIFYTTPEQKEQAEASKKALDAAKKYSSPVVTEIIPEKAFYRAEEYHQKYNQKHGSSACHI